MVHRIYKLTADSPDGMFFIYIGKTSLPLQKRLKEHRHDYNQHIKGLECSHYVTSYEILKYGYYNAEVIEETTEADAKERESYWIRHYMKDPDYIVVNKRIEDRTRKEYQNDNKEHINEVKKKWVQEHYDQHINYHKDYYAKHKEEQKAYRENKKEHYKQLKKAYNAVHHECECGGMYIMDNKAVHFRTKKHQTFINSK